MSSAHTAVPGPRGTEAVRALRGLATDPLRAATRLTHTYGDVVRVPVTRRRALLILTRPEHAEHVLVGNQQNYCKAATYRPLREFLGDGLVTSEGALWEGQRRLIQPHFAHQNVMKLVPVMVRRARALVEGWEHLPDGSLVDVSSIMSTVALDLLGEALLGADLRETGPVISRAVRVMQDFSVRAMHNPLLIPAPKLGLGTTVGHRRWRRAVQDVDDVIEHVVAQRRTRPREEWSPDLLTTLLEAPGPDGNGLDHQQIRDEMITFLMAGHETSATALDWCLVTLSLHPWAREAMEQEVDAELARHGAWHDTLPDLPWTTAVIKESLRLYPPFWTLEREALEEDMVGTVPVPAGTTVAVPPYLIHRHPDAWSNPEGFDPTRFQDGPGYHRYAWIPFGGGRRGCVGSVFATAEMTVLLAVIAERFRFDLLPGHRPEPMGAITLRPRGKLRMRLRRR